MIDQLLRGCKRTGGINIDNDRQPEDGHEKRLQISGKHIRDVDTQLDQKYYGRSDAAYPHSNGSKSRLRIYGPAMIYLNLTTVISMDRTIILLFTYYNNTNTPSAIRLEVRKSTGWK
jgi:ribosomal protein L28